MARGGSVDIAQQAAAAGVDEIALDVDRHLAHPTQVDRQTTVRQRLSRYRVPAAADGRRQPVGTRDADRGDHVLGAGAAQDHSGTLVDHGVPHRARITVTGVVGADQVAFELGAELPGDASPHLVTDRRGCR
jgi:hypothetical protein